MSTLFFCNLLFLILAAEVFSRGKLLVRVQITKPGQVDAQWPLTMYSVHTSWTLSVLRAVRPSLWDMHTAFLPHSTVLYYSTSKKQ